ncbi:P-type ATPase [Olsenella phocaeensis]|uniref:P-type ATPase n=1 Tax=Olsenella phocaeensis TaxID=1852385 RepID=UPI001F436892|nr:hypothetical protein [Olsenella phocaeensis]
MDIRPDVANLERDGELVSLDPTEVHVGDVVLVRPGEKVPLDGIVLDGRSSLNTVALTGESLPRDVAPGDDVASRRRRCPPRRPRGWPAARPRCGA